MGETFAGGISMFDPNEKLRPPFIAFSRKAVEDREASMKAGVYTAKDIDLVLITPHGSKDRIERVAEEWLQSQEQAAREDRIPAEWPAAFRRRYEAWVKDEELPEDGIALKNWPVLSPSQLDTLLKLGYRTVEDVSSMNEEGIARMGMGGRNLKRLAEDFLASSSNGKFAQDMEALRETNKALELRLTSLSEQMTKLASLVPADKLKALGPLTTPKEDSALRAL